MSTISKDEPAVCSKGSVTVVVRVRGQNAKEAGAPIITKVVDQAIVAFDPKPVESPNFFHGKRKFRDINKRAHKNALFQFDRVFDENSTNADIYQSATKDIVIDVLNGFNACVFAYGATGAGKTFTMLGTAERPGVIFMSVMSLYERIGHITEKIYDIAASYLEVYNEQICDLLTPGPPLALREDSHGDVVSAGLSLHKISSAAELLHMLEFGNKNRTQHPTDANAESSRSHAVFQVYVKQRDRANNTTENIKVAKLSLIDLAGSERATVTTNRGARFREGANINRSLLALGNCINALADGKSKGHVPYRDSKLTRLLKDSLGGNCRTVMIAAVSPSALSYEDTYNTLRYANRAKEIKVDLKQNSLSVEYHISQYPKMLQELRKEVASLKAQLSEKEFSNKQEIAISSAEVKPIVKEDKETENRFKKSLKKIFDNRVSIRKELLELEGSERVLALKLLKKEMTLNRLSILADPSDHDKTISELQRSINATRQRIIKISQHKADINQRMKNNASELDNIESQIKAVLTPASDSTPQLLQLITQSRHLEVEVRDSRQQVKYLKKISRIQQREAVASEKLISMLLKFARRSHSALKDHGLATIEAVNEFASLQRLLRGPSEVVWEDCSERQGKSGSNGVTFEQLLQFPTLVYRLTPCPVYDTRQSVNVTELSETLKQSTISNVNHQAANSSLVTMDDTDLRDNDDEDSGSSSINNMTFTISSDDLPRLNASQKDSPSTMHPPVFIGQLSFDDVKSPAKVHVRRSPLKSSQNTIVPNISTMIRKRPAAPSLGSTMDAKCASIGDDKMRRVLADSSSTVTNNKPSYMQMTFAASHKHLTFARSVPSIDGESIKRMRLQPPARVPLPSSKPSRLRTSSANARIGVSSSTYQRKGIVL